MNKKKLLGLYAPPSSYWEDRIEEADRVHKETKERNDRMLRAALRRFRKGTP